MATIVVIDDDDNLCDLIATYLANEGHTTYVANNGESALALLEKLTPDLVLLDVCMPIMDGFGFVEQWQKTCPIVMMTAYSEMQDKILELKLAGKIDSLLIKPFVFLEALDTEIERLAQCDDIEGRP